MKNVKIILPLMLCIFYADALTGASLGRATLDLQGKKQAPTIEDYADHFRGTSLEKDLKKEAEADKLRVKSIDAIAELLKKEKDKGPKQFELMLRMGELYVERHDFMREVEIEKFKRDYETWAKDEKGPQPKINHDLSKKEMNRAANTFRALATNHPKHPRTAQVLFVLAKTLSRLGMDSAVLYYEKLLKDHPKSDLIPDTYLALGEHYFEKAQADKALTYYKQAMKFKEHRAYPYAVYKLGWAHYNLNSKTDEEMKENLSKSVSAFKLVIRLADKNEKEKVNTGLNLREEAIKDLIMVWADAGDIDSAWAYFKTIGEQDSFYVMLERLGGIYASQGKNDKAIQVYARLLKEAPNRKTNPDVHLKLVELFDLVNRAPIAYTEAEEMTKLYLGDTTWTKKFPDETTETSSRIERNLHRYGASYHSRGIKTKSTDHLKVAARFYALYLQNFPKTEVAYEIRFYFAEILHEFNQYDPAAAQYMLVSRQNPTKGKYAKESATNAVVALNSLITAKTYPQLPPLGQVPSPLPIPQEKIRLVEALDNYIKHWGTDKESHPMYITAAKTYFDHGHYQPAIDRFIRTTDDIPGTLQAEAAARTVISYYSDKSEWANVVKWCQHFEKNEPLMKQAKVAEQIRTAYQAAAFNIAVNLEKEGKHADAAAAFVAYEGKFKGDKNSEKALFFASANLYRAGDIKRAIEVQNTFLQNYPKSDLRPDVLASLAETHEAIVQFKMAAGYYLELGQSYPTDKRAAASLMNASVLFRGVGDLKMAERALEGLVKGFPQSELLGDGILALAEVKESLGDNPEAKKHYDDFTKRYAKTRVEEALMAQARSAKIAQKSGSDTKGEAFKALTTALSKSPDLSAYEARALAAGTHFQAIEPRITAFKNMNINSEKLEDSIKAMQNELLSMSESYENVMSIGSGEYIVASLYRLGELHEIFADKMLNAPMAAQASATEINEIRSALEGLALPLKEEAYGYYETAFKRSSEVETFSIWTRLTYEKMSELQPSKNPEIDALITKPTYMTHKVLVSGSK